MGVGGAATVAAAAAAAATAVVDGVGEACVEGNVQREEQGRPCGFLPAEKGTASALSYPMPTDSSFFSRRV